MTNKWILILVLFLSCNQKSVRLCEGITFVDFKTIENIFIQYKDSFQNTTSFAIEFYQDSNVFSIYAINKDSFINPCKVCNIDNSLVNFFDGIAEPYFSEDELVLLHCNKKIFSFRKGVSGFYRIKPFNPIPVKKTIIFIPPDNLNIQNDSE